MPSRCFMPSENPLTRRSATASRPVSRSTSVTRRRADAVAARDRRRCAGRCGRGAGRWRRAASPPGAAGGRGSVAPARRRAPVPLVGASRPRMIRIVVVFPAPFGPRKPVTWPGRTVKLRPSTAVTGPNRLISCRPRSRPLRARLAAGACEAALPERIRHSPGPARAVPDDLDHLALPCRRPGRRARPTGTTTQMMTAQAHLGRLLASFRTRLARHEGLEDERAGEQRVQPSGGVMDRSPRSGLSGVSMGGWIPFTTAAAGHRRTRTGSCGWSA